MINQEKQSKANYIVRLDHQFPFEQFGKKWVMYVPGGEGFYCISEDFYLLSLERKYIRSDNKLYTVKQKLLKYSPVNVNDSNLGNYGTSLLLNNIMVRYTKLMAAKSLKEKQSIQQDLKEIIFPFKLHNKNWIMWLPGYENLYALSDDIFVLSLNSVQKVNLDISLKHSKVLKWTMDRKLERLWMRDHENKKISISRDTVLKQVSKFLKGMPDD